MNRTIVEVCDPQQASALPDAVLAIAGRVAVAHAGGNLRTCGVCSCLCRIDEACPVCRADLVKLP